MNKGLLKVTDAVNETAIIECFKIHCSIMPTRIHKTQSMYARNSKVNSVYREAFTGEHGYLSRGGEVTRT